MLDTLSCGGSELVLLPKRLMGVLDFMLELPKGRDWLVLEMLLLLLAINLL